MANMVQQVTTCHEGMLVLLRASGRAARMAYCMDMYVHAVSSVCLIVTIRVTAMGCDCHYHLVAVLVA